MQAKWEGENETKIDIKIGVGGGFSLGYMIQDLDEERRVGG